MRLVSAGILGLLVSVALAQTEQLPQQPQRSELPPAFEHHQPARDGGVREVLESIVIPPIPNAPFRATLATEAVKYSFDGATLTFVNQRHIARDGQGRIYEERWLLVPKNSHLKSYMNWIQIADPKQRTLYNCSPQKKICDLVVYDPAQDLSAAQPHTGSPHLVQTEKGSQSWEDLGARNILGVDTVGFRETTITNAGVLGNDQPLISMSEYWHSDRLGINLLSIRSSPFFGRQTFTITELTAGEPDEQLFELPDYPIHDQRTSPPISQ
jgi:hypothetical protein